SAFKTDAGLMRPNWGLAEMLRMGRVIREIGPMRCGTPAPVVQEFSRFVNPEKLTRHNDRRAKWVTTLTS
ncbi:MAG: hypothetical protein VYA78_03190, partial [Chloroflexota bacterium]|nr:hypothetical protein [Chloroflexota bacterium]